MSRPKADMANQTLHIRDPWTMPYLEYEQEFIDELHREIGPDHPLYKKRVYVVAGPGQRKSEQSCQFFAGRPK
jgi:hypothetical protein